MVVDEEQDSSYKQELAPRYNGRDLALVRAQRAGAVALLVSATPSLESRWNVEAGKLAPLVLTARAGQGSLPEGILVDLREEAPRRTPGEVHVSERPAQEIAGTLAAGGQAILLRNRRGYSPVLLCRACGEDMRCEDCGLPRTYHRRGAAARLPLLRLDAAGPRALPGLRRGDPGADRRRHRAGGGAASRALPRRRHRRPRPRQRAAAGRTGGAARALRARRRQDPRRHPDGLEGAPLPGGQPGRRAVGRQLSRASPTSAPSSGRTTCSPSSPAAPAAGSGRARW